MTKNVCPTCKGTGKLPPKPKKPKPVPVPREVREWTRPPTPRELEKILRDEESGDCGSWSHHYLTPWGSFSRLWNRGELVDGERVIHIKLTRFLDVPEQMVLTSERNATG